MKLSVDHGLTHPATHHASFTEVMAHGRPGPIVLSSPHSGHVLPADVLPLIAIERSRLRALHDGPVDALVAGCATQGAPILCSRFSRAFVDLNRHPRDLDPAWLDASMPREELEPSIKGRMGLGVVPTRIEGAPIYRQQLGRSDVTERLATGWTPYHARLEELREAALEAFGAMLLLDCHSMPSEAARCASGRPVDVVVGDRHGQSAHPVLVGGIARFLADLGMRVVRNQPYAGGYITERYGMPKQGCHAVQIELRRSLFMDEATGALSPDAARLAQALRDLTGSVRRQVTRRQLVLAA